MWVAYHILKKFGCRCFNAIPTYVGLIMADVVFVEILSIQSLFSLGRIASRIRYLYERNDLIPTNMGLARCKAEVETVQ